MNLTASLHPVAIVDLFVVREVSLTHPQIITTPGGILSQHDLTEQFARERIKVPELAGGFLRLVAIQGGLIGSLHVGERTLTLFGAGVGAPVNGEVWDTLTELTSELRTEYRQVVRGPVPASWDEKPTLPSARPWLAVAAMDGMAWYGGHQEVITKVMREVVSYFIALGTFSNRLVKN